MAPADARAAYDAFVARVRALYAPDKVQDGVFGAMMRVSLVNDGPVTFCFDSRDNGGGNGGNGGGGNGGGPGKSSGSSLSTMATAANEDGGGGGGDGGGGGV
jgi:D-tyrosyl-tRNA(Tyr) deacylase